MLPCVTVLMSVHNGAAFLPKSIDSILQQTFEDFELLIIDDASTDETPKILTQYQQQDPRIRLMTNPKNLGLTASLNRGLQVAQGQYIARQDADDISMPERLQKQIDHLNQHPECVLVGSNIQIIDDADQSTGILKRAASSDAVRWYLHFYNHMGGHSAVTFRRDAALAMGGYDVNFRYSQDYDLWVRLSDKGSAAVLPEVLVQWRQHAAGISSQKSEQQEHLSLLISQRHLTALLGDEPPLEVVAALRGFWTYGSPPFPDDIHPYIKEAYQSFSESYDADSLRPLIARRYVEHVRRLPLSNQLKISYWRYAAQWHLPTLTNEIKHMIKGLVKR